MFAVVIVVVASVSKSTEYTLHNDYLFTRNFVAISRRTPSLCRRRHPGPERMKAFQGFTADQPGFLTSWPCAFRRAGVTSPSFAALLLDTEQVPFPLWARHPRPSHTDKSEFSMTAPSHPPQMTSSLSLTSLSCQPRFSFKSSHLINLASY